MENVPLYWPAEAGRRAERSPRECWFARQLGYLAVGGVLDAAVCYLESFPLPSTPHLNVAISMTDHEGLKGLLGRDSKAKG